MGILGSSDSPSFAVSTAACLLRWRSTQPEAGGSAICTALPFPFFSPPALSLGTGADSWPEATASGSGACREATSPSRSTPLCAGADPEVGGDAPCSGACCDAKSLSRSTPYMSLHSFHVAPLLPCRSTPSMSLHSFHVAPLLHLVLYLLLPGCYRPLHCLRFHHRRPGVQ